MMQKSMYWEQKSNDLEKSLTYAAQDKEHLEKLLEQTRKETENWK